jgi:murein L,D-transpeptidase YafK
MIAFLQRGPRSFVAILATALVLPTAGIAQELGGPAPNGAALGIPYRPSTGELLTGLASIPATSPALGFRDQQLRFPRVRSAYQARAGDVRRILRHQNIAEPAEIFFRVFKRERLMEVWARGAGDERFVLVNTYAMCGMSGELGAKRERGDEQIPEGFYAIDVFNPASRFHLSLGVDYPNAVDRARGVPANLGGDIFIHGGCATIGCVPVTDAGIEEVYVMALMAREAGQARIPVHMFPTRLDDDGFAWLRDTFGLNHPEFPFWENLREGYLAFERTRTIPRIDHFRGRYTFPRGVALPTAERSADASADTPARSGNGPLGVPVQD